MNKLILSLTFFLSLILVSFCSAQTDSILVSPTKDGQCSYMLTVKNRNAQQQSIDEIRLQIVTADGTTWQDATGAFQWGAELTGDFDVKFTAQVNLLAAGATLSGFKVYFNIAVYDKPVTVNWTTLNGTQTISTGSLSFICTPFQSLNIDTVTVVPSVINNDPYFDFRVFNRNDFQIPISRFVTQLQTIGGGTMRPSKITAPAGWQLDSVTALYAYFRTTTSPIAGGDNLSGFKVCLRGNPAVNKFTFNWFTYEEGDALLGRDTIRNISVTFSGSASEADSLSAAVVNGCLYALTVKNYHVSNSQPPSKIRKIVLLSKTPGLIFTAAPSAPVNWSKTVTQDSIVYTASADSSALSSSKVTNLFRFSVDPPNANPFKVGWRTYKTLSEVLSTGEMQLQCNEQPPLEDNATLDVVDTCNWNIRITNQHNTPASDLYAIELSIPAGSGILTTVASSLAWTKTNETATSVRFSAPSPSGAQSSGTQQSILFAVNPQTPGAPITLTWKTFDEAALQSNTPLKVSTFSIACSPIVNLCDSVTVVTEPGGADTCMQNFTVHSHRKQPLTGVTMVPQNGWTIDSVLAPAGWDAQLDANKTLVSFTNTQGIAPDGSQSDFRVRFSAVNQSDTFNVIITTIDVPQRGCDTSLMFICKSQTAGVHNISSMVRSLTVVPNPVSHDATIELQLENSGRVHLTLIDILGHEVANVANSIMQPGTYSIPLRMGELQAGTYYLRLQTPQGIMTTKVVLTN